MILLTDDEGRRRGERSAGAAERRLVGRSVGRSGVFLRPLKAAAVGGSTTTTAAPAVEPAGGVGKGRGVESEWRGRMEVIMRDKMNEGMERGVKGLWTEPCLT